MHRFRSIHTIRRLRLSAVVLLVLRYLVIPGFFGILIWVFLLEHPEHAFLALWMLPVIGAMALWGYYLGSKTNCPLCSTPVLSQRSCNKHRNARPLFFSYKLRVALSALLTNSFRCPYCNEPSVLEVRKKGSRSGNRR